MIASEPARAGRLMMLLDHVRVAGLCILFALGLAGILAFQGDEPPRLEVGKPSPKTILAPERVTYPSVPLTEAARAQAAAQVKEVYDPPDARLARQQVQEAIRIFNYFDALRHDPYSSLEQKIEWARQIPTLTLPLSILTHTLMLDEPTYARVVSETIYVLDTTMRNPIRPGDLYAEYAQIPARISLAFSAEQAELIAAWVQTFVRPNSFFNPVRTDEERARARAQVGTVYRTFEKGQAIVREGEMVTPLTLEALAEMGILRSQRGLGEYAAPVLAAILLTFLLAIFIARVQPTLFAQPRALLLVALVMLTFIAGAKVLGERITLLHYLYPLSAAAMLLTVLSSPQMAFAVAVIVAVAYGLLTHGSFEMALYALAGGMVAAASLGRIERLTAFLWSGAYVAATNVAVVALFRALALEKEWTVWATTSAVALGNGALAGLLALGSVLIVGKLFGITTALELLDLARPTHPLLNALLAQAPGTYHHSLIVSQLAEQAAQRIGADALLVRVAAYYHDVGKTYAPHCFVENQMDGVNIHDTLSPHESARIVIEHVPRGLALAQQYGLPECVRAFIPQHHGTTLAAYFHLKALAWKGNSEPLDEQPFRYPGPKPQSRETAIVMLADGIEATARAERPTTPEQIHSIIERIINDRLRDGQLDDSTLTLRDLSHIKEAFFSVLQGLYHPRVKYPDLLQREAP